MAITHDLELATARLAKIHLELAQIRFGGTAVPRRGRNAKALLRMFKEGLEGFKGGMSAGKYSAITGASPATTTRDLADLIEKGALVREGERRHARYRLSVPLRHVPHISVNEHGERTEQ